jgi:hypothetical protein
MGVTLHRFGLRDEALECCSTLLRLNRTHALVRFHIALIKLGQGDEEEARWHLGKFLETAEPTHLKEVVHMVLMGVGMGLRLADMLEPLNTPLAHLI